MEKKGLKKKIYAVNFDFSMEKLKELYPNKNYTQAYDDIKRFLTSHGFEHRQGSGYMSVIKMTEAKFNETIYAMFEKHFWMLDTLRTADVTVVEKEFDLLVKYRKQREGYTQELIKGQVTEVHEKETMFSILQDVVSAADPSFRDDEQEKEFEPEPDR